MKTCRTLAFSLLLLSLSFLVTAQAGLLFPYYRLATKNLDEMNKLVQTKIKESRKSGGDKSVPLKEALQAVFSRPNDDAMIEKILSPLRNELEERDAWEKSIKALVKEALGALKNPKAFRPEAQVSYALFLENLSLELKAKNKESFEKSVLEQIRDAKIELSKECIKEKKLRLMKDSISPSDVAAGALIPAPEPVVTPEVAPAKE